MKKLSISICCVLCCIISGLYCVDFGEVYAEGTNISVNSKSCYLIDFDSETVLFEENADERVPVASIVKLMTTLITFEEIDKGNLTLDEKLVASEYASSMGGSQVFIDPYEEYTIEEMIKSVIVASANDATQCYRAWEYERYGRKRGSFEFRFCRFRSLYFCRTSCLYPFQ